MFATSAKPQTATETITNLSLRLASSSLLEDRRAAILGLRSFAKDFPASVASEALRGLIGSLSKDGDDVDTVKVVLVSIPYTEVFYSFLTFCGVLASWIFRIYESASQQALAANFAWSRKPFSCSSIQTRIAQKPPRR